MATVTRPGPFARKPTEHLTRETSGQDGLKRAVGVLDLTALGIGAIVGTGIFVTIGEAISDSGPSIVISFALAGGCSTSSSRSSPSASRRRASSPDPTRR